MIGQIGGTLFTFIVALCKKDEKNHPLLSRMCLQTFTSKVSSFMSKYYIHLITISPPFFCLPLSLVFLNNFFFTLSFSLVLFLHFNFFFYIFSLSRLLPFLFGFDFVLPQQPHGIFRHFYIQTKLGFIIQEDKLPTPPPLSLCPLTFLSLSLYTSSEENQFRDIRRCNLLNIFKKFRKYQPCFKCRNS